MALMINHNLMAAQASRNLNASYGALGVSTRRLSSGLRIGTAADDAAGLAIRELMRADITSLNQGMRNANDAVSMIQTADGALQIIDEKLIRMKELATQASTGTYNSDQRLIIDSEYQAMASEINRIASATDFNGIHLLNGNLEGSHDGSGLKSTGAMKIHFGTGNDSAEDYYYIGISEMTAGALSVGNRPPIDESLSWFADKMRTSLIDQFESQVVPNGTITQSDYDDLINNYPETNAAQLKTWIVPTDETSFDNIRDQYLTVLPGGTHPEAYANPPVSTWDEYQELPEIEQREVQYQWANAAMRKVGTDYGVPQPATSSVPGTVPDDQYRQVYKNVTDEYNSRFDEYGDNIRTQEGAQKALNAITNAIVSKDHVRAHLGAMQNRLENTITNLSVQAENMMAAESRISDVDVATEMTEFVRQQIKTQAATAMLSQANSLPKMAMQLIGG